MPLVSMPRPSHSGLARKKMSFRIRSRVRIIERLLGRCWRGQRDKETGHDRGRSQTTQQHKGESLMAGMRGYGGNDGIILPRQGNDGQGAASARISVTGLVVAAGTMSGNHQQAVHHDRPNQHHVRAGRPGADHWAHRRRC